MRIEIVAAIDKNNGIGFQGQLPWPKLPADLKWFRRTTERWPVIMGSNTWKSLPTEHRPLENRQNIVVTNDRNLFMAPQNAQGGVTYHSCWENALEHVNHWNRVFCIGGASLYTQLIEVADTMWITQIKQEFKCDTFFPQFDPNEWNKNWVDYNDKGKFNLTFWHYERIKNEVE